MGKTNTTPSDRAEQKGRVTKRKRTPEPTDRSTRARKRGSMSGQGKERMDTDVSDAVDGNLAGEAEPSLTINFTFDQFKTYLSGELRENRKEIAADNEKSLAKLTTDLERTKADLGAYKKENSREMQLSLIHI